MVQRALDCLGADVVTVDHMDALTLVRTIDPVVGGLPVDDLAVVVESDRGVVRVLFSELGDAGGGGTRFGHEQAYTPGVPSRHVVPATGWLMPQTCSPL